MMRFLPWIAAALAPLLIADAAHATAAGHLFKSTPPAVQMRTELTGSLNRPTAAGDDITGSIRKPRARTQKPKREMDH
jgi:hypothetical protein